MDAYISPDTEDRLRAAAKRVREAHSMRWVVIQGGTALIALGAAIAFAVLGPVRHLDPLALVMTALLYFVCRRLRVPVGAMWTVPIQLAVVPMFLLLPPALVPAVAMACEVAYVVLPGGPSIRMSAILMQIADSVWALGPATVLLLLGPAHFSWGAWPVYVLALVSQALMDGLAAARYWLAEGSKPTDLGELGWMYLTDFCLSCVALPVAAAAAGSSGPAMLLLMVPALGLMRIMAQERSGRFENSLALSDAYRGTAELLGEVIEDDDAYTAEHSRDVAELAVAVATRLGLDSVARRSVEFGALLHDVGKVRVPHEILKKAGKLDESEWVVMRQHTADGERMLQVVGGVLSDVGRIVRHTHERYDGTGYPDRLCGEQIPIESRVIAVADAWNAMTTSRTYRKALSTELALEEMRRCAGTHFDPDAVDALLEEITGAAFVVKRARTGAVHA
ncbi:MAG: HD-GYP domain-containing protein [Solirubrobacterales bacterium]|nr:HD-GYP domain-containing protein [Solirubrobacterales bacterium]